MKYDNIKKAYAFSKNIYDAVLSQQSILSRLYSHLFWAKTDDKKVAAWLLNRIPDDFTGRILDVPCGTTVFTEKKWEQLTKASIVCLDYSQEMLHKAESRLRNTTHIRLEQGDVCNLTYADNTFDLILSMNGFHAFPNKQQSYEEIYRVLKPHGRLLACFYIQGKSYITDFLVKEVLSREGWFTPPFITEERLKAGLMLHYTNLDIHIDGSIVYFQCEKI